MGYQDVSLNLQKQFRTVPVIVGNIFSWGIIGAVVDFATGSAYQLTPEQLSAALENDKVGAIFPQEHDPDAVHVVFFDANDLK